MASEYVPAAQGVTAVDPTPHALPTVHTKQPSVAPSAVFKSVALPYLPLGHDSGADDPAGQYDPAVQSLHAVLESASVYLPAAQFVHVGCFCWLLNVPGAHGVACAAPTEQNLPTPHVMHCDSLVITARARSFRVPCGGARSERWARKVRASGGRTHGVSAGARTERSGGRTSGHGSGADAHAAQ